MAVFAITLLAYLIAARLGLLIAIQPSNASPIYPAAGVGMVAALLGGRPALLAIPFAAMAANVWSIAAGTAEAPTTAVALMWFGTGIGAAAQAAVGAWMLRRFVAQPLTLSEPTDLARFMLLIAPLACCVSASVAVPLLLATGAIEIGAAPFVWGAWWIGDALGVLIGAPVFLTLVALNMLRKVVGW